MKFQSSPFYVKSSLFGKVLLFSFSVFLNLFSHYSCADTFVDTVSRIKSSIVGVGIYDPLGNPRAKLMGTGFIVDDEVIATNHHVVHVSLTGRQQLTVFSGKGKQPDLWKCTLIESDEYYDLALLKCPGIKGKSLVLATESLPEGSRIAFTGFPIGAILGLYPVTHEGIISSISPVVIPAPNAKSLNIKMLKRLKNPYMVYQLDATAYPGNSGSPVYDQNTGAVIGIVNKVFVKGTKESVLKDPSGITYAIPATHLVDLLNNRRQ